MIGFHLQQTNVCETDRMKKTQYEKPLALGYNLTNSNCSCAGCDEH